MKPLQSVAMGLVIVVLVARFDGYDALADPVGWLLVIWGVRRLADRATLLALALTALLVAGVVCLPATQDLLDRNDPSLRWAVNLPQVQTSDGGGRTRKKCSAIVPRRGARTSSPG